VTTDRTGRTVIILRPAEQAVRLADALRAAGMEPYALPLTDTGLPSDPAAVVRELEALGRGEIGWLVVTSANAVRALELIALGTGTSLGGRISSGGARVAAVGASTAGLLADAGIAVDLVPARQSAAGLLDALGRPQDQGGDQGRGAVVLLPQADLAPTDLATGLTASGWVVRRVEAYRTVPYPAAAELAVPAVPEPGVQPPRLAPSDVVALAASGVRPAVVFLAPSAVRQFHDRVAGARGILPIAIGDTTADALREAGHDPTVAAEPSPTGIARAAQRAFEQVPAHPQPDAGPPVHPSPNGDHS
jgi:uroporphyrinogen-III synthase